MSTPQQADLAPPQEPAGPPEPQPVLNPLTRAAIFLVVAVSAGGEPAARDVLGDLAALQRSVGFRAPDDTLACVAGVGSQAWDRLFAGPRPAELHPFRELAGSRHRAMATAGDLVFHVRAEQMGLCFEFATHVMERLSGAVTVCDEVHGFRYFDDRDLLGFVDGTENPTGPASVAAAITGAGDPGFAGGSYLIVQKYVHDMGAWNALSVEEQERVIGRTKLDDIELPDDVKPSNSHVAVNTITDEFGTYYAAYSATPSVTERMLERMFIGDPPGNYDRILDFSTAVTGNLFFVPSAGFLDDLPDPPVPAGDPPAPSSPSTPPSAPAADGSLGIGGLKRSSQQ
jgi:putative iron-dependent peroxidase